MLLIVMGWNRAGPGDELEREDITDMLNQVGNPSYDVSPSYRSRETVPMFSRRQGAYARRHFSRC